mgnify:CR=1 FL=1
MSLSHHDNRCANASRANKGSCRCICKKKLHGIPHSDRTNALLIANSNIEQARDYSSRRVKKYLRYARKDTGPTATKKCSDLAASIAINTVIHDKESSDLIALVDTLSSTITALLIDKVTSDILQKNKDLNQDHIILFIEIIKKHHLVCLISCKLVELITKTEKEICEQVKSVVEGYLKTNFPTLNDTLKTLIIAASEATAKKMCNIIKESTQISKVEKAIQLITLIFCPDYSEHPEVLKYCFSPLTQDTLEEQLSDFINRQLPTTPKGYKKIEVITQSTIDRNSDLSTLETESSSDSRDPYNSHQYQDTEAKESDLHVPQRDSDASH